LVGGGGAGGVPPPAATRLVPPAAAPPLAAEPSPPHDTLPPERSRGSSAGGAAWLWVLLVALLIGGGVAAYLLTRPKQVVVPIVVNYQQNVAIAKIDNAGLTYSIVTEPNTAASGLVVGQDPLAGTKVDENSSVRLVVSDGPGNRPVPTVIGMSKSSAEQSIKKSGLKVGSVQTQYSPTVAVGDAVSTVPGAGTSVAPGYSVTLFISLGPPPVKVPSVVGDTEANAKSTLSTLNVTVMTSQQSSSQTPGTVISQSRTGSVPANSTITLVIAEAPPMVKVPTVTGDTVATASKALKAAGFAVTQTTTTVTDPTKDGTVVSQSPTAGAQAKKGATVTIVVGMATTTTTTTSTGQNTTTTTTSTTP